VAAESAVASPPSAQLTQSKASARWFDWGADFRLRSETYLNASTLQDATPNNESSYLRLRPRIWTTLNPHPDLSFTTRLVSEPRYYFQPHPSTGWANQETLLDLFNLRWTNLFHQPVAVTVGRQEFCFGNKWLVWDGTCTDGTRTEFFDAARITFDAAEVQTTFDAIYLQQDAATESWLPVFNETNPFILEQKERGAIFYLQNRSLAAVQLDAYAMYRQQTAMQSRGNRGETWLVGGRLDAKLSERWRYRAEFAPEFGRINGADLRAWGANQLLTVNLGGAWQTKLRVGHEYLSGNDPGTTANEGWEPMWARRAQWSELMVVLFGAEHRNRAGDYKNLQRPNFGLTFRPTKKWELSADYSAVFANENPFAGTPGYGMGNFRGHFGQAVARYTFDVHWSGVLWAEMFLPGNYYAASRQDPAYFFRSEIYFKF